MKYLIFTILFLISRYIIAQEDSFLDSVLTDILGEDISQYDDEAFNALDLFDASGTYHFLYVGSSFNNKTTFAGREIGNDLYNSSGQLYYFSSNGIFAGLSGIWYSQLTPGYKLTLASVGFTNSAFKENIRFRISYNHLFYSNMGDDFKADIFGSFSGGLTAKYKNLGTRIDYSLMVSNNPESLVSSDLFYKFRKKNVLGLNIEFQPEISLFFSNESVEYILNSDDDPNDPFYVPIYELKDKFGLLNTEISFPLSFEFNDFEIELNATYNIPHSLDAAYSYDNNWQFSVSMAWIMMFKK